MKNRPPILSLARCFALARFAALPAMATAAHLAADPTPSYYAWAEKPPMGWNSWDGFATTLTEAQAHTQAAIMAEKLAPAGWNLITVDIQWYEPNATGFSYRKNAKLEMDAWGRLLPAVNRFPSAANGLGFKPLADHIHSLGLKFGVHLMRGIPRQAVVARTPIKGTHLTAADIADTTSTCPWNGDMYGVDLSKPGAQEYYDSVFEQFAAWGLDFIKVDDLSRPYHQPEIEAIRRAIDHSGRAIVFSTSPGATPLASGGHISTHANMWRISDDFWDEWPQLLAQFDRLRDWTAFRGPGHFPDADMLPVGTIALGKRRTHFSRDEQHTLLSLWSIARSPLILGADLTKLDDFTLALITNAEVTAVDQASTNNRELFRRRGLIAWVADAPGPGDKYLALFNVRGIPGTLTPDRAIFESPPISRQTPAGGVDIDLDITGAKKLFLVVEAGRGRNSGDFAVWSEPTLVTGSGLRKLTELKWTAATSGRGEVTTDHNANGEALQVAGHPASFGISTQAESVIEYELPEGATRFRAIAGINPRTSTPPRGPAPTVQFLVFIQSPYATEGATPIAVTWADLGVAGPREVRDLWLKQDLGPVANDFAPLINAHGAGLYRVSPVQTATSGLNLPNAR